MNATPILLWRHKLYLILIFSIAIKSMLQRAKTSRFDENFKWLATYFRQAGQHWQNFDQSNKEGRKHCPFGARVANRWWVCISTLAPSSGDQLYRFCLIDALVPLKMLLPTGRGSELYFNSLNFLLHCLIIFFLLLLCLIPPICKYRFFYLKWVFAVN